MKNKTNQPLISIIMPVYNPGQFLLPALESIINQTHSNWELIAVDDASTDNSYQILKNYAQKDKRIQVFRNKVNSGVSKTANFALQKAQGQFIARMDSDDVMYPSRLEKQVKFLLKNPDTVLVGGQCLLINEQGLKIGEKRFPTNFQNIKKMIFWNIPVQQPTTMVNTALLPKDFVWYDNQFTSAEEVELLFKFFKLGKVANLKSYLLKYRIHGKNTSLINPKETFYLTFKSRIKAVYKYGYIPSAKGIFISLAQLMVVTFLPEKAIYPIYSFIRGQKKFAVSISTTKFQAAPTPLSKLTP
jgi:glycosyltransferase involved in cell wall biosynthesis